MDETFSNSKCFLFYLCFFHEHSRFTGQQGDEGWGGGGGGGYLHISQVITAESSPLHIASSLTRNGNIWFSSVSR